MAAVDERDNEAHVKDIQKKISQPSAENVEPVWSNPDQELLRTEIKFQWSNRIMHWYEKLLLSMITKLFSKTVGLGDQLNVSRKVLEKKKVAMVSCSRYILDHKF